MGVEFYFFIISILHIAESQYIENARVVNMYKDSVDLVWDPYPNATRYSVNWVSTDTGTPILEYTISAKDTIIDLEFGSNLTIYISAVAINGKDLREADYKSLRKPLTLTIDRNVSRPAVVGLKISSVNDTEFTLSWDPYPFVTQYNVIIATDLSQKEIKSNEASIKLKTDRCKAASLVRATEMNNTLLEFFIQSSIFRFYVPEVTTTRIVNVYNNSIDLSWDAAANIALYRVELINSSIYFTSKKSFSILNLNPNTMYTIEVTVGQINGAVVRRCVGKKLSVKTKSTESRPEVQNLTLTESNEKSLSFQWNTFENATSYKVSYRSKISEKSNFTSSNEYTFEDLHCDTEHTVSVEVFRIFQNEAPQFIIKSQDRTFSTATCAATIIFRLTTSTMCLIAFLTVCMIF